MYKLCKTEQSANRQRNITNALFELMRQKIYEDITVTEICERMNMPRKAFYRYFDSKEDALTALIDHSMLDYTGFSGIIVEERHRSLSRELEEFFRFWYGKRELILTLDRSSLLGTFMDRIINYPIEDRIALVRFLPNEDAEMRKSIFKFALCGLVYMTIDWYKSGFRASTKEMARTARRMFESPLFPNLEEAGFDL